MNLDVLELSVYGLDMPKCLSTKRLQEFQEFPGKATPDEVAAVAKDLLQCRARIVKMAKLTTLKIYLVIEQGSTYCGCLGVFTEPQAALTLASEKCESSDGYHSYDVYERYINGTEEWVTPEAGESGMVASFSKPKVIKHNPFTQQG